MAVSRYGYEIQDDGHAIKCLTCGRVSHNLNDVKHRYCGYCHTFHEDEDPLAMWTIYEHPLDFPASFVARKFLVSKGAYAKTDMGYVASTLAGVRQVLTTYHPGLTRLPRNDDDDPFIVETWL